MDTTANIKANMYTRFLLRLKNAFLIFENPSSAVFLSLVIFTTIISLKGVPWRLSDYPYYNYLADAFLHGQLHLRLIPPLTLDLSIYEGKYYLYWGPLPAITAIPWVITFGVGASDYLQTIAFGSINVGFFALLLRKITTNRYIVLTPVRRALFVLFFMLGTMQTPITMLGSVWYLVHLQFVTCSLLAFLAVFSFSGQKAFFYAGCAVAGILLTRPSGIFAGIFLTWYLIHSQRSAGWWRLTIYGLIGLIPPAISLGLLGLYNFLRFGSVFNNGVQYHLMGDSFRLLFEQYGVFSPHYIPINFYLNYIYYPGIGFGASWHYPVGGSLFLLSPLFIAMLYSLWQDRQQIDTWVLWITYLIGNIPILMIMAPGSWNVGPRYLIDVILPLLLLTAKGLRRWPVWLISILVAISVLQYLLVSIMIHFPN